MLSPEEAQRRTDELIQKLMQEDQANEGGDSNDYYDEETLPDEQRQIEVIRRIRHNEVADEAQDTLRALQEL